MPLAPVLQSYLADLVEPLGTAELIWDLLSSVILRVPVPCSKFSIGLKMYQGMYNYLYTRLICLIWCITPLFMTQWKIQLWRCPASNVIACKKLRSPTLSILRIAEVPNLVQMHKLFLALKVRMYPSRSLPWLIDVTRQAQPWQLTYFPFGLSGCISTPKMYSTSLA